MNPVQNEPQDELAELKRRLAEAEASLSALSTQGEEPGNGKSQPGTGSGALHVQNHYLTNRNLQGHYRNIFDHMFQACAIHEIIYDQSGNPVDYRFLDFNPAFEQVSGLECEKAIGRRASEVIPNLEPFWVEVFGRIALTRQSLQFDRYSQAFNRYFRVYAYSPQPDQVVSIFQDITEFKLAEGQLNEVAEKYFTLFNNTSDGMWIHNLDGEILEVNDAYCRMSGYSRDEILHMPVAMLEASESPEEVAQHIKKVVEQEGHDRFETVHRRKDGSLFDVDITALYFDLEGGRIAIFARDITQRKQVERRLAYLASFPERNPNPIVEVNIHGLIHYINPTALELFPDLAERGLSHAWFADWETSILPLREGREKMITRNVLVGDRWYLQTLYPVGQDNLLRIYATDITEHKLAEQAARLSEAKYRTMVETAAEGIALSKPDGEITYVNQQMADMLGYPLEEIIGKKGSDFRYEDDLAAIQGLRDQLRRGDILFGEFKFRRKDGSAVWSMYNGSPIFNDQGEHIANLVMHTDITERKRWETTMQENARRLNRAEEIAHLGSWELDLNTNQITWSNEVYRIFGYEHGEIQPSYEAFLQAVHPEDRLAVDEAYRSSIQDGRDSYEIDHRLQHHKTGDVRIVHEKCVHIRDESGNIIRSEGMIQDITESKQYEKRLEYLASFPEDNPRPIIEIDLDGQIIYTNPIARSLFPDLTERGLTHEYLVGYRALVRPFSQNVSKVIVRDVQVGDRYYQQSYSFFSSNKLVRIYGVDVTERKLAEQALHQAHSELELRVQERTMELKQANALLRMEVYERQKAQVSLEESFQELQVIEEELRNNNEMLIEAQKGLEEERQRYQDLFERAPEVYLVTDLNGQILGANQIATQLLQISHQKLIGKPLIVFIDPSDHRHFRHLLADLQLRKEGQSPELKILPRSGDPIFVAVMVSAAKDDAGIETLRWAMRDITGQKQAQDLIRQNSMRNEVLSEVAQSLTEASLDEKAILDIVVKTTARLVGDSCVIAMGSNDGQWLTPAAWAHRNPLALRLMNKVYKSTRLKVEDSPSAKVYQNSESVLIPNVPGSPDMGYISEKFHDYAEKVGVSSLLVVPIIIGNKTIGTLGITRDKGGNPYTEEDESLLEILADRTAQAIHNARLYKELQDALIKELEMQEQLVHSEKFAVVGRLLASITHEINNPLQTIKNCLYLIEQEITSNSPLYDYLNMATRETDRLSNLVAQLREIYRPPAKGQTKLVNLPSVIDEVHTLLVGYLQEKHVSWTVMPVDTAQFKSIAVEAVSDQLKQVFLNIALNAIDAMELEGGSLTIILSKSQDDKQVGVCFKDTGPGVPDEVKAKLFEPFVTTKEKGLGLGLVISYDIIQKHGGHIDVESEPGKGAAFTIWLPVMAG